MEKTVEGVELVANITDPLPCVSLPVPPSAYLGIEVSAHGLLGPRLEVELSSALFLWVTHHIGHGLREMVGGRETIDFFLPSRLSWTELYPRKCVEILTTQYL